jgi:hypothetical protein
MDNAVEIGLEPYRERRQREREESDRAEKEERRAAEEARQAQRNLQEAKDHIRMRILFDESVREASYFDRERLSEQAQASLDQLVKRQPGLLSDGEELKRRAEAALAKPSADLRRRIFKEKCEELLHRQLTSDGRLSWLSHSDRNALDVALTGILSKEVVLMPDDELGEAPDDLIQEILDEEGIDFARGKWIAKAQRELELKLLADRRLRSLPYAEREHLKNDLREDLAEEMTALADSEIGSDVSDIIQDLLDEAAEEEVER